MSFKVKSKKATPKKTVKKSSPKYLIEGRKWFDKTYGNTYHTVTITDLKSGKVIHKSKNMHYGYGNQWETTAYKELEKQGKVKEENRYNHELNRKRFIKREFNVSRKRDLF